VSGLRRESEEWFIHWTEWGGGRCGVSVTPLHPTEPPSETRRRLIEAAREAGWTPPRWWQWWRWNDTRVVGN
jgi:hypothetical protein